MGKQRQVPGGPYVNATDNAQRQIPGYGFIDDNSGGSAYSVSVSEAASASDSPSASVVTAAAAVQAASASDSPSCSNTTGGSCSESASASDTPSAIKLNSINPTSDVSPGSWISNLGGSLYAAIDEPYPPDESGFIRSGSDPVNDLCEIALSAPAAPAADLTGTQARYMIRGKTGLESLTVSLYCGATLVKSWSHSPLPSVDTIYVQDLSPTDLANITDQSNLRYRFNANA